MDDKEPNRQAIEIRHLFEVDDREDLPVAREILKGFLKLGCGLTVDDASRQAYHGDVAFESDLDIHQPPRAPRVREGDNVLATIPVFNCQPSAATLRAAWRFAFRRVFGILLVLFVAVVLTFGALQFVPGDPILILLGDQSGDVELEARRRAEYGLDRPLTEQFVRYLGGVLRGDFGLSFRFASTPVKDVLATGLAISPVLALAALVLSVPLGIGLGTFAARRKGTLADSLTMLVLTLGISIPNFALAAFLVYLLAVRVPLLPVAGWGTPAQAVLPLMLLVVPAMVYIGRLTRTYMLEILQEDYIRTARAKQDPYSSLDPRMRVEQILSEPLTNFAITGSEREARIDEALDVVGLALDARKRYPHMFSGGQRQRIGIARALVLRPKLLICDEAVSALDVSIQAQILNLLRDIQERYDLALLFISHNLAVVRHLCHRIAVMYMGGAR